MLWVVSVSQGRPPVTVDQQAGTKGSRYRLSQYHGAQGVRSGLVLCPARAVLCAPHGGVAGERAAGQGASFGWPQVACQARAAVKEALKVAPAVVGRPDLAVAESRPAWEGESRRDAVHLVEAKQFTRPCGAEGTEEGGVGGSHVDRPTPLVTPRSREAISVQVKAPKADALCRATVRCGKMCLPLGVRRVCQLDTIEKPLRATITPVHEPVQVLCRERRVDRVQRGIGVGNAALRPDARCQVL